MAQLHPCLADWLLIKERAAAEELESRWSKGSSSLLLAGVLAALLSALSTLPLLNLLFRRASCLNGMILIKIVNSRSENRPDLPLPCSLQVPSTGSTFPFIPHNPVLLTCSITTDSNLPKSLHYLAPSPPSTGPCCPFKSLFGLPTSSSPFPPAHHPPRVPPCQAGGRSHPTEDEQEQMQDVGTAGVVRRTQLRCPVSPQHPSACPSQAPQQTPAPQPAAFPPQ